MASKKKQIKRQLGLVRCVWGLICSLSSIDQERNNISLFNVIDQLNIPEDLFVQQKQEGKPLIFPLAHELVLLWRRTISAEFATEPLQTDFKISIFDPTGKAIQETIAPLILEKNIRTMRLRIKLMGFPLTVPGDYVYRIELRQPNKETFEGEYEIPFFVSERRITAPIQ